MNEQGTTTTSTSATRALTQAAESAAGFAMPREQFLSNLLAAQCELGPAANGAVLRMESGNLVQVLAAFPALGDDSVAPPWLSQCGDLVPGVVQSGQAEITPLRRGDELYGQPPGEHLILLPLIRADRAPEVAAFLVRSGDQAAVARARERLALTSKLLSIYDMQALVQRRTADLHRVRTVLELVAAVSESDRFKQSAMALCNETAARFGAERVSLGILHGRYVKLHAMSHQDKFRRKMRIVQDLESVMEECLDQDVEVVHPPEAQATSVSRVASQTAARHGPMAIISLPLRRGGRPKAVLTLEREADRPFTPDEAETLRLVAEMCAGWVLSQFDNDRWIGAKIAASARTGLTQLVGPQHTWIKVAAIGLFGLILFLVFARGEYRIEGSFVVEAPQRRVIPAPFDGYLKSVHVKPGDRVVPGQTVLATLYTAELELELAEAKANRLGYQKEAETASRDGKTAEAQMAALKAQMIQARIDLLEHRIGRSEILSPIEGVVIGGDLESQVGAPFETGQVLFEVAPLKALRAGVSIPEQRIADVQVGDRGELAAASHPGTHLPFEVERIDPVAEVVDQKNIFRVRVRLLESAELDEARGWLKPGMEGVAKVSVGRRSYLWLWSIDMVRWIRMRLWI